MASYIDQVKAVLSRTHATTQGRLWGHSTSNRLPSRWLFPTPTEVWGKPYSNFRRAQPGAYPDFNLRAGSSASEECRPLKATVKKPSDSPALLYVGHSEDMVDAVYETMVSADKLLDITLMNLPTGRYLAAMRNAVTFLSNKPEDRRPIVRVLLSAAWDAKKLLSFLDVHAIDLLSDLARDVRPPTPMTIYVGVFSSSLQSWNHSKIVAADATRALVGGHNLWEADYLDDVPVFDVSMSVEGDAVLHAHDFIDVLWRYALSGQHAHFVSYNNFAARTRDHGYVPVKDAMAPVDVYTELREQLRPIREGSVSILAVGRHGHIPGIPDAQSYLALPANEPSDDAILELVKLAKKTVRFSLQALTFMKKAGLDVFGTWNRSLFMALGKKLQDGVDVFITLSNPGAGGGDYHGDPPSEINGYMLGVLTNDLGEGVLRAKQLIVDHFHPTSFRYSDEVAYIDAAHPQGAPIPNHAKTVIVDDSVFYMGSQNLYLAKHNEFGFIVEDAAAAQAYIAKYWQPMWEYSKKAGDPAFGEAFKKDMEGEALLFVLELRRNRRLARTWFDTLEKRKDLMAPDDLMETANVLHDIITDAGFVTTTQFVLEVAKSTLLTEQSGEHAPNNESRRFVVDVMTKRDLLNAFAQLIEGPSGAPTDAAITAFLRENGYACTAAQVAAAMDDLRNEAFVAFFGEFDGWIRDDGGTSYTDFTPRPRTVDEERVAIAGANAPRPLAEERDWVVGPKLMVVSNRCFTLGDEEITAFQYKDGVLSWDASGKHGSRGSLTFGRVTRPGLDDPFTGDECFGTVTWPEDGSGPLRGTVSYYGRWNKATNVDDPSRPLPIAWIVGILAGLAGLIAFAAAGFAILRRRGAEVRESEEVVELLPQSADREASPAPDDHVAPARLEGELRLRNAFDVLGRQESIRELRQLGREEVSSRMKTSLEGMVDAQANQVAQMLELRPADPKLEALAQTVHDVGVKIRGLRSTATTSETEHLFREMSTHTAAVSRELDALGRRMAEARSSTGREWIKEARTFDARRVECARRANEARSVLEGESIGAERSALPEVETDFFKDA